MYFLPTASSAHGLCGGHNKDAGKFQDVPGVTDFRPKCAEDLYATTNLHLVWYRERDARFSSRPAQIATARAQKLISAGKKFCHFPLGKFAAKS